LSLSWNQNNCTCKPGYFGNGSLIGSSPCPICAYSYYCAGGNANTSVSCPVNFTSAEGSSSFSNCLCKPGYQLVNSMCQLCPAGGYCQSGNLSTCPLNSYSTIGSANISSCVCIHGFSGTNGECFQCPADSFCTGGMSVIKCVANAVSPVQSTNATACYCDRGYHGIENSPCTACPEGTWCWTGVLNHCPLYTWSPMLSSWWKNCTCIPGYTGPDGSQCEGCVSGTYKSENGSASCTICPAETFCPSPATNKTQCNAICAAGSYETTACSNTTNRVCTPCATGTFQTGEGKTECELCSPGKFNAITGSAISSDCTQCANGTFAISPGASRCENCPAECAPGTYETTHCMLSNNLSCSTCTAGSVCVGGTSIVVCSPGM
jgi:hypothetical protein